MSSRARIGIVLGAVVVLVVAFVIASSSGDDDKNDKTTATQAAAPAQTTAPDDTATATATGEQGAATATTPAEPAEPAIPVVTVKDAKPVGGIKKIKFTKGDTIKFKVVSDTADEIHFHGYDIGKDVKAGGSATFSVKATIEGRFVVELEGAGQQIAEVEVDPS